MKEEFIHFVWKQKLYQQTNLKTIANEEVEIIHPGYFNSDAGPDFFNAKIKIDNTIWAGNVEIHLKRSDWISHKHENDPKYCNIILHVIVNNDITPSDETILYQTPTLILQIPNNIVLNYNKIAEHSDTLYCGKELNKLSQLQLKNYLEYILIERLEEKSLAAKQILDESNNCWRTLLYHLLVKTIGGHTNSSTFELLAKNLPYSILIKHSNSQFQLEALLFGTAGFLNNPVDAYQKELQQEFIFLKTKYNLIPLSEHLWKFLRLRPSNFPTLRIAQLSAIIFKNRGLPEPNKSIKLTLNEVEPYNARVSEYWEKHYHFTAKAQNKKNAAIGTQTLQMILNNVVIPYLFIFNQIQGDVDKMEKIIESIHEMPTENNRITKLWANHGIECKKLGDSQALYHLYTRYCEPKKCIRCRIGQIILTQNGI